ncbi:hypothetical protein [Streptomyces genisteinicus]|uniref:Uncharacterized protein n=1 Tax=Streptomyces genisteinicus TaxID=2768068 RepID=A0A7H0HR73_9ACTN|nr:hypothetical protein [Streptomyces genisteinicus]QNP63039.1 hypothetical protein IAG43_08850 [Streptomyces genisteinicus]
MRQRVVRLALVGGVAVLVLLLLLSTCGGEPAGTEDGDDRAGRTAPASAAPSASATGAPARVDAPAAYDTSRGWQAQGVVGDIAVAAGLGAVAYLEAAGGDRYRLRTLDAATGEPRWTGPALRPARAPAGRPRLLEVTRDGVEYFAVWSFGKAAGSTGGDDGGPAVLVDLYAASDGARQQVEVAWPAPPSVSGAGPGVLITDGGTRSAVVDPLTGAVSAVAPKDLRPPRGCAGCRRLTEVRAVTAGGLLVSGSPGFWVRDGWASAAVAPRGADTASGVPVSVTDGYVLARWRPARKDRQAATHDIWSVHDSASGKALAAVRCHRPEIEPGTFPRAVRSPAGGHLVAGSLAFDLGLGKGHCYEREDGTPAVTLSTVTDEGVAYGSSGTVPGTGLPLAVDLALTEPEPLPATVRVPEAEISDTGLFLWTDPRDRRHLLGHPRRG